MEYFYLLIFPFKIKISLWDIDSLVYFWFLEKTEVVFNSSWVPQSTKQDFFFTEQVLKTYTEWIKVHEKKVVVTYQNQEEFSEMQLVDCSHHSLF